MRKKWKYFLISAALLTIIFVSIERYDNYIGQKFYQESTQGLLATYEQLDKTFMMFAQRNWNALEDWGNYLNYCVEEQDKKEQNGVPRKNGFRKKFNSFGKHPESLYLGGFS